ncbi:MAG TPA: tetratricopeptide repeat protein [Caulobacteraceae bacterium]|nr:tetratricopeptide repeat protein [Caulobacteraceae bacterium]
MSAKPSPSVPPNPAPQAVAGVARIAAAPAIVGQSGSPEALAQLNDAIAELRALGLEPYLRQSAAAIRAENAQEAAEWAIKALERDERCGMAWYCLAIAREKAGDFKGSLQCYESALALSPDHIEIANNLGRLAYRMGMSELAEQFFRLYLQRYPNSFEPSNNLACALRDQQRYAEAVEVMRGAIEADVENPLLWNTLGTVLTDQGEFATGITFFDEALRLDPSFIKARYNRSTALLSLGDPEGALVDCEAALAGHMAEHERATMELARATMLIAQGRLQEGWDAYEARLSHHYFESLLFMVAGPAWTPDMDLRGKTLLVFAEQGLGDEVLFANLVPDLIEALGPEGLLMLAVEPRLVSLFQRAFPTARIEAHTTYSIDGRTVRCAPFLKEGDGVDAWAPLGSLLRRFRPTLASFPARPAFLKADPARVAYWRGALAAAPPGPKVGILWKSLKLDGARLRYFSPFDLWAPVLTVPGVTFVNLQYGDSDAEQAQARAMGVTLWTPPGIDLKMDLDDLAALTQALDLLVAPANATSNIAAACGAPVWLISTPGAWPKLGTDRYPWYPSVRVFNPPAFNDWSPVMDEIAQELVQTFDL